MKALLGLSMATTVIFGIALIFSYRTKEFEYKEHEYIQFSRGVVHNPDCKYCLSKYD